MIVLQERIPLDQVFEQLTCSKEGLTNEEGRKRLELFGPNKLEEKKAMNSSPLATYCLNYIITLFIFNVFREDAFIN